MYLVSDIFKYNMRIFACSFGKHHWPDSLVRLCDLERRYTGMKEKERERMSKLDSKASE